MTVKAHKGSAHFLPYIAMLIAPVLLSGCTLFQAGPTANATSVLRLTVQASETSTTIRPIQYTYVITNTGTVPLAGPVIVTDSPRQVFCPNLSTVGNSNIYLDLNETVTCSALYTITQADVTLGSVTNVAIATVGGISSNYSGVTAVVLPMNMTPANNAQATLFSAIGTHTAVAEKMQATLVPMLQTVVPTPVPAVASTPDPAAQTVFANVTASGLAAWALIWFIPILGIAFYGLITDRYRLHPFLLFLSHPNQSVLALKGEEIDTNQLESSGLKRLLILLDQWSVAFGSQVILMILTMVIVWPAVIILTWPSITILNRWSVNLLASLPVFLALASAGILVLLQLLGKSLGISWHTSQPAASQQMLSEKLLSVLWVNALTTWSIGLPALLLVLAWPGPLLFPRPIIGLMVLLYFMIIWRQVVRGTGSPPFSIFLHLPLIPFRMAARQTSQFIKQTYLYTPTSNRLNLRDGGITLFTAAAAVFLWLSLSGDEFWSWILRYWVGDGEWPGQMFAPIPSYYLPIWLEEKGKILLSSFDFGSLPAILSWLPLILKRPGVFSGLAVLAAGWLFLVVVWALSSTLTGIRTNLKKFDRSEQAVQAALIFVATLAGLFLWRALIWTIISLTSATSLLPIADIFFGVVLSFLAGGWIVLGIRYILARLRGQKYYLLPLAAIAGTVLGPILDHLLIVVGTILAAAWLIGNLPSLWLVLSQDLAIPATTFLTHVRDAQAIQLGQVLYPESVWLILAVIFLCALGILYGAIGIFLRLKTVDENPDRSLFIKCLGMEIAQLGLAFVIWSFFSAPLNLTFGFWWHLQKAAWAAWFLPFISITVFGMVYAIIIASTPRTKSLGGLRLFGSILLWPIVYRRPLKGDSQQFFSSWRTSGKNVAALFKCLYLPLRLHPRQWSYTLPDTESLREFLSIFSLRSPYTIRIRWTRLTGAGFADGQAIVYFLTDTLISTLIWPWLPGAAVWLAGSSFPRDRLLVDPGTLSLLPARILWSQGMLFFACIFWGLIITLMGQLLRKSSPLPYQRTGITLRRMISSLLLAVSMVHLFFLPIHIGLTTWLQSSASLSESQIKLFATLIFSSMAFITLLVFGFIARTTLQRQFQAIFQAVSHSRTAIRNIQPGRLMYSFWNFIAVLLRPSEWGTKFPFSRVLWTILFLQLIGFGMGWIALQVRTATAPSADVPSFMSLIIFWMRRLVGLNVGILIASAMSIPAIYNFSYMILSNTYRVFNLPISFLETAKGQLPAIPRLIRYGLGSTLLPRRLIYPGYRHILQSTLLALWFSNSLIALVLRPLEASFRPGETASVYGQWGWLELIFTIFLASYLTANLTRSIPFVVSTTGLLAALLAINYANLLRPMAVFAAALGLIAIVMTATDSSGNLSSERLRRQWPQILTYFRMFEAKWFLMEAFAQLDKQEIDIPQFNNQRFESSFRNQLQTASEVSSLERIKFGQYEEDPIVQSLRIYFYKDRDAADKFVGLLLSSPQPEPSQEIPIPILETITEDLLPGTRRWVHEAAIRARFMEMENTQENYLLTLMQLRAARLLNEVRATFDQVLRWQPLPMPIHLIDSSAHDEKRRTGDLVVPRQILRAIWAYTDQEEIDIDEITNRWEKLLPSPVAEEILKAFSVLLTIYEAQSLTSMAALTFSEKQIFGTNYEYMVDLNAPMSSLATVAETIARAEELATQDRPQFYVSALQQLQRLLDRAEWAVCNPERLVFRRSLRLWNTLLTEALSTTIIPRSQIEIEVEQFERAWEQEEIIVLVVANRAQGTAYNLQVHIHPGEGYQVVEPLDGIKIEMIPGQSEVKVEFRLHIDAKEDFWINLYTTYDDAGQPNHTLEEKKIVRFVVDSDQDAFALLPLNFDLVRNPYHYGLPITDPGLFFGRDDIMNKIRQIIGSKTQANIVMLYGQRRMGKSTILRQMLQQCKDGQEIWPIFIDTEIFTLAGTSGFLWELAQEIWRGLPQGHNVPKPLLSEFKESPGTFLIKEWMPLVDTAVSAAGRSLLLLLDEFDLVYQNPKFQESELREILGIIRGLAHERRKGGIIYVGTYRLLEMTTLYQTPLFNQAVPIRVSFLDDSATEELIRQPAKGLLKYDASAVSKIIRLTGNHPYYLQLLCSSIFERAMNFQDRRIRVSDVISALEQAHQQGGLILDYLWKENTAIQKYIIAALARLNERETSRATISRIQRELSAFMIEIGAGEVQKSIEALSQWEIILNDNGQYYFTVDLFRLWLREHKTLASVRAEVGPINSRFRQEKL